MNVLIACEESQTVTKEFRKLGHNTFSCDILECSGGHPEWHFKNNIFEIIENKGGYLQTGNKLYIEANWDLMIAHPPCTYLSVSGARWYYHPDDSHLPTKDRRPHPNFPDRAEHRKKAIDFFIRLYECNIDKVAIENPVSIMSTEFRKPDQIVQPYMFGDEATKTTCLWLKNLPELQPTKIVDKGERTKFKSGKSHPKWYADVLAKAKTDEERRKLRSKTFKGFAQAMAKQWGQ